MIFSKPYHITDDDLLPDARPSAASEETPLEYHVNYHSQSCTACGQTNVWSELTLLSFHRTRKARTVRAAQFLEYNLPLHVHHHDPIEIPVCGSCAALAWFALRHLPQPERPRETAPPRAAWRDKLAAAATKVAQRRREKLPVTDDDLIA